MTTPTGQNRLGDGFHDVPHGKIATVVTHLEMTTPPPRHTPRHRPGWSLRREHAMAPDAYRALFRRIGEQWLWFSRLGMSDAALSAALAGPDTHLSVLESEGEDAGIVELCFRQPAACELRFFGVIPDLIGCGAGRFMMSHALVEAWARPGVQRVTVHTCTLDHPGALPFYVRSGFTPVRQQVEIAHDPRLSGALALAAAPHVPVISGG
jgi:GNAT superfamily N-acetyltransferase